MDWFGFRVGLSRLFAWLWVWLVAWFLVWLWLVLVSQLDWILACLGFELSLCLGFAWVEFGFSWLLAWLSFAWLGLAFG